MYRNQYEESWFIYVNCKKCNKLSMIDESNLSLVANYFPMPANIDANCTFCNNLIVSTWATYDCPIPKEIVDNLFLKYKKSRTFWKKLKEYFL